MFILQTIRNFYGKQKNYPCDTERRSQLNVDLETVDVDKYLTSLRKSITANELQTNEIKWGLVFAI